MHHYLAFMGSARAQQVAYSVAVLHKFVYECTAGTKGEIVDHPEIGLSCAMRSSRDSDPISNLKRRKAH